MYRDMYRNKYKNKYKSTYENKYENKYGNRIIIDLNRVKILSVDKEIKSLLYFFIKKVQMRNPSNLHLFTIICFHNLFTLNLLI